VLTDREIVVLKLRLGWNGKPPYTLEAAGRELGVTRERIRQVEALGLKKLLGPSFGSDKHSSLEVLEEAAVTKLRQILINYKEVE
jgi:DNA-directed RNA polymerase sigma subunit (sigma70/sigma32)